MAITVTLRYGVWFGTGDSSDWIDYEVELDGEAEEAYKEALRLHEPFDSYSVLDDVLAEARWEIEENEIDNFIDYDDPYVIECTGRYPVDPDEINDLVAARDPYTLDYFDLSDLSDEELDEWDACDLDDLPDVCDFDEEFESTSPFDEGWELLVEFSEDPEDY